MENKNLALINEKINERNAVLTTFYARVEKVKNTLNDLQKTFKSSFDKLTKGYSLQLSSTLAITFNQGYDTCFTSCNGYHRHYNNETLQQYIDYGYYGVGIEQVLTEIESLDLNAIEERINNDLLIIVGNYANETLTIKQELESDTESETESEEESAE